MIGFHFDYIIYVQLPLVRCLGTPIRVINLVQVNYESPFRTNLQKLIWSRLFRNLGYYPNYKMKRFPNVRKTEHKRGV